ncbi:MAG: hypothetical protein AAB535_00925 [Patescibacteria group bacterium]
MVKEILQNGVNASLDMDNLRQELGAPRNPLLFPPHFLKATFPKIGGKIVIFPEEDGNKTAVFLFPRDANGNFTARIAHSSGSAVLDSEMVQALNNNGLSCTEVYNPEGKHTFNATYKLVDGIDIGRPDETEAAQVRELQRQVWGSTEDFLYPSDIHSVEFGLATTLVARQDGQPNWTVDPLQLPNVILNFNKLGGICYEYHSNYYQFQNALNQVRASRLAIEWLINSPRVEERLANPVSGKELRNIGQIDGITVVNNQAESYILDVNSKDIAIQIPEDWSGVQTKDLALATKWRDVTDTVLEHYIRPDRFTLTEVVIDSGRNFYLLGQKLEDIANL